MNDIDPLLHEAMANVNGPVDLHPSVSDVHRRARRHYRRRMVATAGAVACTGVATAALIIRRDSTSVSVSSATDSSELGDFGQASTTYLPLGAATTVAFPLQAVTIDPSFVWSALANIQNDPAAVGLAWPVDSVNVDQMPTAETFGCIDQACGAMFNYIVWNEIARAIGYFNVAQMQGANAGIDFGQPPRAGDVLQSVYSSDVGPPTTVGAVPTSTIVVGDNIADTTSTTLVPFDGIMLIDGGAPAGAMDDAYQRLNGYNRTIVPGSGKTVEQTILMPIGGNIPLATAVGGLFGIDGFDTWDPSFLASPIQGMVAVVIGPDYFDRVQNATPTTSIPATTTSSGP